jgi:glycosyltransferase involved in cell wall biosynthesis
VLSLKENLGISAGERVILAVGRLSKEKAHIDLIAAFKQFCETNPNSKARLVIVGEGPERERLSSAAQRSGCGKRISLVGQASDVRPFYALADMLVLPSHSEGSPNVLLEAMAALVPIVATAVGGVPEIVTNNEHVLLVSPKDPAALAAAILRLHDPELTRRLITNASALVSKQFSPEAYARSLVSFYREVIDQRSS